MARHSDTRAAVKWLELSLQAVMRFYPSIVIYDLSSLLSGPLTTSYLHWWHLAEVFCKAQALQFHRWHLVWSKVHDSCHKHHAYICTYIHIDKNFTSKLASMGLAQACPKLLHHSCTYMYRNENWVKSIWEPWLGGQPCPLWGDHVSGHNSAPGRNTSHQPPEISTSTAQHHMWQSQVENEH